LCFVLFLFIPLFSVLFFLCLFLVLLLLPERREER
jgi:hypothetical protein